MTNVNSDVSKARGFTYWMARGYWTELKKRTGSCRRLRRLDTRNLASVSDVTRDRAQRQGSELGHLEPTSAGLVISKEYAVRLPASFRSSYGIYYTPLPLVSKMIKDAKRQGVDFSVARVIDPSSGGAAFLSPLARVMFRDDLSQEAAVKDVSDRLCGVEVDPFAAWLSQFFVDCVFAELAPDVQISKRLVTRGDALSLKWSKQKRFDYVVGNPPYGKVPKGEGIPEPYHDITAGRANRYYLFLKLAISLGVPGAVIHQLTPTSYLSGKYASNLRGWIIDRAHPVQFDLILERTGVFDSVQQEMAISMFRKHKRKRSQMINNVSLTKGFLKQSRVGRIQCVHSDFWMVPRTKDDVSLASTFHNGWTLENHGFRVRTGYVVPHRQEELLSKGKTEDSHPLIWSDAIQDSRFYFDPDAEGEKARWFIRGDTAPTPIKKECLIVKRTSSKEQLARLNLARVPLSFIKEYGGFYAENHVNVIVPGASTTINLGILAKLLRTEVVDRIFRCLSGTATVSATELKGMPLPDRRGLLMFAKSARGCADRDKLNRLAVKAYDWSNG